MKKKKREKKWESERKREKDRKRGERTIQGRQSFPLNCPLTIDQRNISRQNCCPRDGWWLSKKAVASVQSIGSVSKTNRHISFVQSFLIYEKSILFSFPRMIDGLSFCVESKRRLQSISRLSVFFLKKKLFSSFIEIDNKNTIDENFHHCIALILTTKME